MKAAIISIGSDSSSMLKDSLEKYFDHVDHLNLKRMNVILSGKNLQILHKNEPMDAYDCVYARGSFRYAVLLRAITTAISAIWPHCYMPIAPQAYSIAHDKILTHIELQKHGIPQPKTYLSSKDNAKDILKKINYPIIMKLPHGTQGKGVMYAESFAAAASLLDTLTALNQPFLIQEYIETGGTDIRAIVVADKIVASMRRIASVREKRSNLHAGGKGEACILDYKTAKMAVAAAACFNTSICGVDILEGRDGPVVIELNISPGLKGITSATKIDVADEIARFLAQATQKVLREKQRRETSRLFKEMDMPKRSESFSEFVTSLDFRGERILLPEFVSSTAGFKRETEYAIKVKKGKVIIEPF